MATSATRPAAVAGDFEDAFDHLFARAYSLALAMVGEALLAEELTVETLARTRVDWTRIVRRSRPDWYVVRVVTLLAIDAVARREPVLEVTADPDAADDDSGIRLHHNEATALRALPRRRREVVALWCFGGYAKPDVAAILALDPSVVEAELELARVPLQQALGGAPGDGSP